MRRAVSGTIAGLLGGILLLVAFITISSVALGPDASHAASSTQWVVAADIANGTRAAAGTTSWFSDPTAAGIDETATAFDGSESLRLTTPLATDGIRVLNSYGAGVTPPSVPQIMAGASYTYSGSNVNFQIEMYYTPADPAYGPDPSNGANRCTPAGAAFPGQCYTVIKWEPLVSSPAAWRTVDLSVDTALTSAAGGWKNTNRIGSFPKPGPLIGNGMSEYLGQIASYTVLGVGASLGTGTAASVGYLQTVSYAGTTYNFRAQPVVSAAAAAAAAAGDATGTGATSTGTAGESSAATTTSPSLAATGTSNATAAMVASALLMLAGLGIFLVRTIRRGRQVRPRRALDGRGRSNHRTPE